MKKTKIAIVGCGNISDIYLENCTTMFRNDLEVKAVCDIIREKAEEKAEKYDIKHIYTLEEILNDTEIDIVVNLTNPEFHAEIDIAVLNSGKHVYSEKPLAITLEDGQKVLETAKAKKLRVGVAPDTFLGASMQTCRKIVDDGWIGKPIGATGFMTCHGDEGWHPDPEFFYKTGGGPMYDMGPYYLAAMISMIGPVKQVASSAQITFAERTITSEPKYGETFKVDVPTHIAGVMNFENGAVGNMITSFDVWGSQLPHLEIYGTHGSLSVPDPNCFDGTIKVLRQNQEEWKEIPVMFNYSENSRGIGVVDMIHAIKNNREHRANGELAYHILEIMHAFHLSSIQEKHYNLKSTCEKPAALYMEGLS